MKKLEAFAQCLNPDLNMKMTDKNLAATQNRLYLELATPAQTIIKDAVVQDSLFVLMASVAEIETSFHRILKVGVCDKLNFIKISC